MAAAADRFEGRERVLLEVMRLVAAAAGYQGMVGGQMLDLLAEGRQVTLKELETIHPPQDRGLAHRRGAGRGSGGGRQPGRSDCPDRLWRKIWVNVSDYR